VEKFVYYWTTNNGLQKKHGNGWFLQPLFQGGCHLITKDWNKKSFVIVETDSESSKKKEPNCKALYHTRLGPT